MSLPDLYIDHSHSGIRTDSEWILLYVKPVELGFALLAAYILTAMWPSLMKLGIREAMTLFAGTVAYFMVCMLLEYSRMAKVFTSIILAFIFLFLLITLGEGEELFPAKEGSSWPWR